MKGKSELGKREKNKEAVRLQLLDAAKTLFADKGMENTTVSDIVKICSLGRGTFYNYFTDIKHIFDKVNENINQEIGELTKKARQGATTVHGQLYATFKAYFDFASSNKMKSYNQKNQAYIRSASYKSDVIRTIIKDLQKDIRSLNDKLNIKGDLEEQILSYVLIGTPAELYLNNMSVNTHLDNHQVADFLARIFSEGIVRKT